MMKLYGIGNSLKLNLIFQQSFSHNLVKKFAEIPAMLNLQSIVLLMIKTAKL